MAGQFLRKSARARPEDRVHRTLFRRPAAMSGSDAGGVRNAEPASDADALADGNAVAHADAVAAARNAAGADSAGSVLHAVAGADGRSGRYAERLADSDSERRNYAVT